MNGCWKNVINQVRYGFGAPLNHGGRQDKSGITAANAGLIM